MKTGICTGIGKLAAAPAGLDFIEATVSDALCPLLDDAAFRQRLSAARQSVAPVEAANNFLPKGLPCTGPAVDVSALDAYVAAACRRALHVGVKVIVFGSGGSRQVPEGFGHDRASDQLVQHMKRWGPLAEAGGVVIALEPLNRAECNIVNSVAEGAELVRRAGHPNIRLLADTYHMTRENEGPEAIRQAGDLLAHVHCSERDGRGPLGTVGEDQRPHFRALKDAGYDGRVSIEAKWTDLPAQAAPALAELRRQIQEAQA